MLSAHAVAVEHIGSTAVPAMLAKPITDLAAGFPTGTDVASIERTHTAVDWIYRGDAGNEGGHVFVLERRPSFRVALLHVVEHDGHQWRRYLALRDRLRSDPAARDADESAKRALAAEIGDNRRRDYTTGRTTIINDLIAR